MSAPAPSRDILTLGSLPTGRVSVGAEIVFKGRLLGLFGSLLGLMVVGGLATLSALTLNVVSNGGESSYEG